MQKKTPDYDNVFKMMKSKHKRMFIPVINNIFGKDYPMDARVDVLPSEGYLTESETADGSSEIEEQISDFLMKIGSEVYLLECQSYDTAPWLSGLRNMPLLLQGSLQHGISVMQ